MIVGNLEFLIFIKAFMIAGNLEFLIFIKAFKIGYVMR
jgi:hypothetical protein